jgi:hypothetical protein
VPAEAGAAPECRWCPVCQLVAVVRGERPEVTAALADVLRATADALHAVAAAAPHAPHPPRQPTADDDAQDTSPHSDPAPVVQRIEIA